MWYEFLGISQFYKTRASKGFQAITEGYLVFKATQANFIGEYLSAKVENINGWDLAHTDN